VDKFLKTEAKIRTFTGLPNKKTFNNLVKYVTQIGPVQKRLFQPSFAETSRHRQKKTGPQRKLSVKEELTLMLL